MFYETHDETVANLAAIFALYDQHGAVDGSVVVAAEPLEGDAVRATVDWTLADRQGAVLLTFTTTYTLAEEDGVWRIVAINAAGEVAAWAAAGW